MAFNLNKTDQQTSKFNLSKGDEPPVRQENKKGLQKRAWIIIALLVAGGLSWYLFQGKPAAEDSATMAVPAVSQKLPVVKDSPGGAATGATTTDVPKPVNENEAENIAHALQNSVPGSFDPGSSSLHPDAAVVDGLVDILSKNPGKRIVIKGYASSEGDLAVNRRLSVQRAISFRKYLLSKGIAADRVTTEAKGIEDPVATNDTEEGRKKNRRVQVTIIN